MKTFTYSGGGYSSHTITAPQLAAVIASILAAVTLVAFAYATSEAGESSAQVEQLEQ